MDDMDKRVFRDMSQKTNSYIRIPTKRPISGCVNIFKTILMMMSEEF